MNGKYQQIIDDKIGELMRVHDDDEEAVTKALAAWFQRKPRDLGRPRYRELARGSCAEVEHRRRARRR